MTLNYKHSAPMELPSVATRVSYGRPVLSHLGKVFVIDPTKRNGPELFRTRNAALSTIGPPHLQYLT